MTPSDKRIKLVRDAVEKIQEARATYLSTPLGGWQKAQALKAIATAYELFGRHQWRAVEAILSEREAEREVVEEAVDLVYWCEIPSDYALARSVRRLLEVRKEREKEQ